MGAPYELEVMSCSERCTTAVLADVYINVVHQVPGNVEYEAFSRGLERVLERHPVGFFSITVIAIKGRPDFNEADRGRSREQNRKYKSQRRGEVWVSGLGPLMTAALRTLSAGFALFNGNSHPRNVVTSNEDAVKWLVPLGIACSAQELLPALEKLRAMKP